MESVRRVTSFSLPTVMSVARWSSIKHLHNILVSILNKNDCYWCLIRTCVELRHGNNNNNGHNNILPNIETPPPSTRSEASSSSSESYSNADGHEGGAGDHQNGHHHATRGVNGLTVPVIKIKTGSATSPPRLISPKSYTVRGHSPIDGTSNKSSTNNSDNNPHLRSTGKLLITPITLTLESLINCTSFLICSCRYKKWWRVLVVAGSKCIKWYILFK